MQLAQLVNAVDLKELSSAQDGAANVDRILRAVRSHLHMDVAFASNVTSTEAIIRYADAGEEPPFRAGDKFPVDDGYCKRILDGRLPPLINDAATVPEVASLRCTKEMPIGAHLSVPLRLSDGTVYGTFCCFSYEADYTLTERDVEMMRAFADLAAGEIEAELTLSSHRAKSVEEISSIISRDNMTMAFQPIYRLADNRVIGVEALSRFPDSELRGPDEWFAEAAEVGLGADLELAAMRGALRCLGDLPEDVYLAINASPQVLLSGKLRVLLRDVPPGRVVLEVTEHAIIEDIAALLRALNPLRAKVKIAVDDAGAGYSGLCQILDIRPEIIKLDRSLTSGINKDAARSALATALMTFGREIGSQIVAEGVETAGELSTLKRLGIQCAQGFHLSRPKPVAALKRFLIAHRLGSIMSGRDSEPEVCRAPLLVGRVRSITN